MHPALLGLVTILAGVALPLAWFWLSNLVLDRYVLPAKGAQAGRNINLANQIRPWLFLFPAFFVLIVYLGYPVFETLRLSLIDRSQGDAFVGLANYAQMFSEPKFQEAITNNMLWLIVVPATATACGLLVAQLTDRIAWGNIAKSLIFMPMAISFVGASVIFKLIYDARPENVAQIGVLNALWMQFDDGTGSFVALRLLPALLCVASAAAFGFVALILARPVLAREPVSYGAWIMGLRLLLAASMLVIALIALKSVHDILVADLPFGEPQTWLTVPFYNNFFLMVVLIWTQTGFAMVILSAALRGVPGETIEAAIIDGANPFQVFFQIKVPQIMSTIVVMWTTLTVLALKNFDIVFAMTNGQWETQVLANYMYDKLFRANDWGVGSAAAIIIMLLVTPILVWNVWNARREMR